MRYIAEPYHIEGIKFLCSTPLSGLFAVPGTGKTGMTLAAFAALKRAGHANRMLVVAPKLVCHNVWPKEVEKFEQFRHLNVMVLHGKNKNELLKKIPEFDIVCISPHMLSWLVKEGMGYFQKLCFDTLVVDESSLFKSPSSKRFGLLVSLLPYFNRRHILTGTPTPYSMMDLWSQCYLLDQGKSLLHNITAFRETYCNCVDRNFWKYEFDARHTETIKRKISHLVKVFDDSYISEMLPPMLERDLFVDLPKKAHKQYKHMERKLFADMEGELLVAGTSAVKYCICRQLANGTTYAYDADGAIVADDGTRTTIYVHRAKLDALNLLLDELNGEPCLIVYYYQHDAKALHKFFRSRYGQPVPEIGSNQTLEQKNETITKWNAGELGVVLCHPDSMAHGLNLQDGGRHVIWYSLTDNADSYLQLNKRLHRRGAKKTVYVHRIVSRGTIDEVVLERVANRLEDQQSLLADLKLYRGEK